MYLSNIILRGLAPRISSNSTKYSAASNSLKLLINIIIISTVLRGNNGVELTFELPDNAKECFYEVIDEGKTSTVEFQVRHLPSIKAEGSARLLYLFHFKHFITNKVIFS